MGGELSFEIFANVESVVQAIFCNAFDEDALDAFRTNGIDYILKPFDKQAIAAVINIYISFPGKRTCCKALEEIFINRKPTAPGALLVLSEKWIISCSHQYDCLLLPEKWNCNYYDNSWKGLHNYRNTSASPNRVAIIPGISYYQ